MIFSKYRFFNNPIIDSNKENVEKLTKEKGNSSGRNIRGRPKNTKLENLAINRRPAIDSDADPPKEFPNGISLIALLMI